ncbi:MAG: UDP-N-acetylmuramoyl-L-alanyl-D-glutamate--2,6-diaminopimelate ligase [Deltaproteobacteria bacterium]|nr:UDP-N-acetylmuramoyl-L-alanyl-D-glutamate--2,6-diaminopimelate ligase [Deltaproteobacteria bacterium]
MNAASSLSYITLEALAGQLGTGGRNRILAVHSGKLEEGGVFVALPPHQPGEKGGMDFLADALDKAPSVIVCAQADEPEARALIAEVNTSRPALCVTPDTRAALGVLAGACYGTAQYRPVLVGVTGTNGKTTSAYLLEALLSANGRKVGVLGTISYRYPGFSLDAPLTTPGCLELHEFFSRMQKAGVDTVVMEVSSHALEQNRVAGLEFSAALLTNVTQDHLDYHQSMENYFAAKARLFTDAVPKADKIYAVNIDDHYGARLFKSCSAREKDPRSSGMAFGLRPDGREATDIPAANLLSGEILNAGTTGLHLRQHCAGREWELKSPLVGAFNAMNLLGVQAVALGLGLQVEELAPLQKFSGVPGRLERVGRADVFVDYAHTPDALVKAIQALRDAGFRRVITVFGCGGNRDRTKRPLMGRAACEYADAAVLTSDNPRQEDPLAIMADVLPGMRGKAEIYQEADRKKATALALNLLKPGDALLVAGKGHENYQIIGTVKNHYSDREVLEELLGDGPLPTAVAHSVRAKR